MKNFRKISAVILAAGNSVRFGRENKLEVFLAGKSVLEHAVESFLNMAEIDEIVIAARKANFEDIDSCYRAYSRVKVIEGGESRNQSALLGVQAAEGEIVLIHDGARPFIDKGTINRCIDGAIEFGAAAAAIRAVDTIKICDDEGFVTSTTKRSNTWRVQSPQAFNRELYLSAYKNIDPLDAYFTDDCMVMEAAGNRVRLVESSPYNIKITTREDLALAEGIAKELGMIGTPRIAAAIGQDSHRTQQGPTEKPMILGGVEFPDYPALEANSDGDVVLHAITNAVSGITGVNILGKPADIICKSGIKDSSVYLKEALKYLKGRITNVSMTIECDKPHLEKRIPEMRESIGALLNIPPERVGITATTGEHLTDFGRGLGISVFCIATAEVY